MLWSPALWLDVVNSWVESLRGRPSCFHTVRVKRKSAASERSWVPVNVTGLITVGLLTLWGNRTPSSDWSLKHDRLALRNTEHVHVYLPTEASIAVVAPVVIICSQICHSTGGGREEERVWRLEDEEIDGSINRGQEEWTKRCFLSKRKEMGGLCKRLKWLNNLVKMLQCLWLLGQTGPEWFSLYELRSDKIRLG